MDDKGVKRGVETTVDLPKKHGFKARTSNDILTEVLEKGATYLEVEGLINKLKDHFNKFRPLDLPKNGNKMQKYVQLDESSFLTGLYDRFVDLLNYGGIEKWGEENIRKFAILLTKLLKDREAGSLYIFYDRDCNIQNRINFPKGELENSTDPTLDHRKLMEDIKRDEGNLKRRKEERDVVLDSLKKEGYDLNSLEGEIQNINIDELKKIIKIFDKKNFLLQNKKTLYNFIKGEVENIENTQNKDEADFLGLLLQGGYRLGYKRYRNV